MRSYPFSHQVAKEIRAQMIRHDLTVEDLAGAVGMSAATVWRRLAGDLPFTVEELSVIAEWLQVPPAVLVQQADHSSGVAS